MLQELNDGLDKIVNIACGANSWIAYSELGLLYSWGMLNDAQPDTINYFPTVLGVPDNTVLSHINAQSREVIACDVHGSLYHCDLEFRRRLEIIDKNKFLDSLNPDFFIRKVYWGRSMRVLLDSLLSPEKSTVDLKLERMETLIENDITIELFDILNEPFSITKEQKDEIFSKIKILFTQYKDVNLSSFKISEYHPLRNEERKKAKKKVGNTAKNNIDERISSDISSATTTDFMPKKKKLIQKPKVKAVGKAQKSKGTSKRPETTAEKARLDISKSTEPTEEEKSEIEDEKNELLFLENGYNTIKFKVYFEIDEEFPSKICIKILPQNGDEFTQLFCRIFVGNTEIKKSNFPIEIVKSQLHLDLEAENERKRERDLKILEQRRLGMKFLYKTPNSFLFFNHTFRQAQSFTRKRTKKEGKRRRKTKATKTQGGSRC